MNLNTNEHSSQYPFINKYWFCFNLKFYSFKYDKAALIDLSISLEQPFQHSRTNVPAIPDMLSEASGQYVRKFWKYL